MVEGEAGKDKVADLRTPIGRSSDEHIQVQKNKIWLHGGDTVMVHFAREWLTTRLMGSDHTSNGHSLRKILVANSPALLAILRRAVKRRRRA